MLQKIVLAILSALALACAACKERATVTPAVTLEGAWTVFFGNDCKGYQLKSDNLVLHPDGTFDQIVVAKDGKRFDSLGQHWRFLPPDSIELRKRRNFFTAQDYKELVGVPELEVLIVKSDAHPAILLHPDSNCFYTKEK